VARPTQGPPLAVAEGLRKPWHLLVQTQANTEVAAAILAGAGGATTQAWPPSPGLGLTGMTRRRAVFDRGHSSLTMVAGRLGGGKGDRRSCAAVCTAAAEWVGNHCVAMFPAPRAAADRHHTGCAGCVRALRVADCGGHLCGVLSRMGVAVGAGSWVLHRVLQPAWCELASRRWPGRLQQAAAATMLLCCVRFALRGTRQVCGVLGRVGKGVHTCRVSGSCQQRVLFVPGRLSQRCLAFRLGAGRGLGVFVTKGSVSRNLGVWLLLAVVVQRATIAG
jgi:hypothetical protein